MADAFFLQIETVGCCCWTRICWQGKVAEILLALARSDADIEYGQVCMCVLGLARAAGGKYPTLHREAIILVSGGARASVEDKTYMHRHRWDGNGFSERQAEVCSSHCQLGTPMNSGELSVAPVVSKLPVHSQWYDARPRPGMRGASFSCWCINVVSTCMRQCRTS